jgi:UDP-N-acetylmuramyl pentapeptide phosphotransferase/UDP-N-acetylglucosamine-1-phosphate transferase
LIGFLSDLNILKSPNIRFILQIFLLIFFVSILDISIVSIRLDDFDLLLKNNYFKVIFTTFCILVLINGTNFIDGLNTLVIGYYILVLLFVSTIIQDFPYSLFSFNELSIIFYVLIFLFILNFFEFLYLGDSGAYLIAIFFGVFLISISNNNDLISPYYVMNLLWYPAYENLFSIIRKISTKYSAFKPDNLHLHQIIYLKLKTKLKNTRALNTLTSLLINLFNFLIFYFATLNYSNTKYQLMIISFSLLVYNSLYFLLKKK